MTEEENKDDKMLSWELVCWLWSKDSHLPSMGLQAEVSLYFGMYFFAAQVKICPEDW